MKLRNAIKLMPVQPAAPVSKSHRARCEERRLAVIVCRSVLEYLASTFDAEELGHRFRAECVPVISSQKDGDSGCVFNQIPAHSYVETSSLAMLTGRSCTELGAEIQVMCERGQPARSPVCVVLGDEFGLVGSAYAYATGRRVILMRRLEDLSHYLIDCDASSFLLVVEPTECAAVGCDFLRDHFDKLQVPWGIATAASVDKLSELLCRTRLRVPRVPSGGVILTMDSVSPHRRTSAILQEPLRVCFLPRHPAPELVRGETEHASFAAFVGHSRSYCGMAGNLCSLDHTAKAGEKECVRGYDCVFAAWDRMPAREIRADVVLVDSCSAFSFELLGPQQEQALSLATHLAEGHAIGVIAPYRTSAPIFSGPYYCWQLLIRGVCLGEICCRLNRLVAQRGGALNPFILLGDPEVVFAESEGGPKSFMLEGQGEGCITLQLEAQPGTVQSYVVQDLKLGAMLAGNQWHCIPQAILDDETLLEVTPSTNEGECEILAIWSASQKKGRTSLQLTSLPPLRPLVVNMASDLIENLRTEAEWLCGMASGKRAEKFLKEFEPALTHSQNVPIISASRYKLLMSAEREIIETCCTLVSEMCQGLANSSQKSELWMYSHYGRTRGTVTVREEILQDRCPHCSGSVQRRVYDCGLWPRRRRHLLECARCMFLSDVEEGYPNILLKGPTKIRKGEPFELSIHGINSRNCLAALDSIVTVDTMGYPSDLISVTPVRSKSMPAPGQEFSFQFSVLLSPLLPRHFFHAKGLVVFNGAVLWALKKLDVS